MDANDPIYAEYDKLLTANPQEVETAISHMKARMEEEDCKFGEKLVPVFLKSLFIEKQQAEHVSRVTSHILSILEKVTKLYFKRRDLHDHFYLDKRGDELIKIDHGYSRNVVICRPDSFFVRGALRFVEFNCDSPAGAGFSDTEEGIFKETFPYKKLGERYTFAGHRRMQILLDALMSCYREFGGKNSHPNIAIIDWREVKTINEFRMFKRFFESRGHETVITDPRDLKFTKGRLYHKDFPIDLIYRRVIFKEMMHHYDHVQDLLKAYKKRKVCIVNPFRSRLASNKAVLSIMTNPKEFRSLFTDEENQVINRHVPWTRRVMDIQTHYENNMVFLLKHIINHKDHLVMKPADSYGGKDVVIGRECDEADWEVLMNRIINNKEDWVVQRYVDITRIDMPHLDNGKVDLLPKKFNVNPFVFDGKYAGSMARLSDESVINVSAGGGLVPVVQYEKK